jgi:hypothetical protein
MLSPKIVSCIALAACAACAQPAHGQAGFVLLVDNDLGMHCMNRDHAYLSILPPYNTLNAQVVVRGDAATLPRVETAGVTLEYAIIGNTYSVGKTDFWDHDLELFGVDLPPNVGLTGKGLTGQFDLRGDMFVAEGIPLTPFPDATPTVEVAYQQAIVMLKDAGGSVVDWARPVVPVSTEVSCVAAGCHSSELDILNAHEGPSEGGFSPDDRPILCASCHGSPPLTGPAPGVEGYFSEVIHDQHRFIDTAFPGITGCFKCHPGVRTRCLRGTMAENFGLTCQDCHGTMATVASSIRAGRVPWVEEPACRTCHTSTYGEPVGVLYRNARGHGGVMCSGCHNSPHAIFPSREERDNDVMVDLQGHAGTLYDCSVCHGYFPDGAGPHGLPSPSAVAEEILGGGAALKAYPTPLTGGRATILAASRRPRNGRLFIYDLRGRIVRLLRGDVAGDGQAMAQWDGRDAAGRRVAAGVYLLRWQETGYDAVARMTVVD